MGRGEGAAERAAMGEAGLERADAEAGRGHGGGGEGPVTLVCRGSSCLRTNASTETSM